MDWGDWQMSYAARYLGDNMQLSRGNNNRGEHSTNVYWVHVY